MKDQEKYQRLISIMSAIVLITVFALSSFAAPQTNAQANKDGSKVAEEQAAQIAWDNDSAADLSQAAIKAAAMDEAAGQLAAATAQAEKPAPEAEWEPFDSARGDSGTSDDKPMATLTSARGAVTVNGSPAQTGATVMSGNAISTGPDGNAIVDLGSLGRLEIRPNTALTITLSPDKAEVKTQCGHTHVTVLHGTTSVTSTETKTIAEGQDVTIDGPAVLSEAANSDVAIGCADPTNPNAPASAPHGGYITGGKIGVIALLGVAGGIAAGIVTHGSSSSSSQSEASSIQR
jgi:hypothetical protein